jgi:hypothetical protein
MTPPTHDLVLRPVAVLPEVLAVRLVDALHAQDVSRGGTWNAGPGVWQRYDRPWDGVGGSRGTAELVGSVAVTLDRPHRGELSIYKVSLTRHGLAMRWTPERLLDVTLSEVGLTGMTCPREGDDAALAVPMQRSAREILHTNLSELRGSDLRRLLHADVRELVRPQAS